MALPIFSVSGGSSVTLSRGPVFALDDLTAPRQRIGRSTNGTIKVASLGDPEQELVLQFDGLDATDKTNMLAFLAASDVNYAENAVTYTDTDSVDTTVRLIDSVFTFSQTAPGRYQLSLRLRVES